MNNPFGGDENKAMLSGVVMFLALGSFVSFFFGGQLLMDVVRPPDRSLSKSVKSNVINWFFPDDEQDDGLFPKEDKKGSLFTQNKNYYETDDAAKMLAELEAEGKSVKMIGDSPLAGLAGKNNKGVSGAGDKPGMSGAGLSGLSGVSGGAGAFASVSKGGGAANSLVSSKGASGIGIQDKKIDLGGALEAAVKKDGKNGEEKNKELAQLKNTANEAFSGATSLSASQAKNSMDVAFGQGMKAKGYSDRTAKGIVNLDKISAPRLMQQNPTDLKAADVSAPSVDNAASSQDSLNKQITKALKSGTDPTSGLTNQMFSGLSNTYSSATGSTDQTTSNASTNLVANIPSTSDSNLWLYGSGYSGYGLYGSGSLYSGSLYSDSLYSGSIYSGSIYNPSSLGYSTDFLGGANPYTAGSYEYYSYQYGLTGSYSSGLGSGLTWPSY